MCCFLVEAVVVALVGVEQPHQSLLLHLAAAAVAVVEEQSCGYLLRPLVLLKQSLLVLVALLVEEELLHLFLPVRVLTLLSLHLVVEVAAAIVLMDPRSETEVQEDQVAAVQNVMHVVVQAHRGKGFPDAVLVIRLVAVAEVLVARVGVRVAQLVGLVALE